ASAQGTVGIVVAVVGVATLLTGGGLALLATSANSSSKGAGQCLPNDTCSDSGLDKRDRALKLADASTVVSIAGLALTATGTVIWLTAPKSRSESSPGPSARLGVGAGSLLLRGQF